MLSDANFDSRSLSKNCDVNKPACSCFHSVCTGGRNLRWQDDASTVKVRRRGLWCWWSGVFLLYSCSTEERDRVYKSLFQLYQTDFSCLVRLWLKPKTTRTWLFEDHVERRYFCLLDWLGRTTQLAVNTFRARTRSGVRCLSHAHRVRNPRVCPDVSQTDSSLALRNKDNFNSLFIQNI